jgi:hypothetical protein
VLSDAALGGHARAVRAGKGLIQSSTGDLWRAEAHLRRDRSGALAALERSFAGGAPAEGLEGALDGRLVTTTLGYGLDLVVEILARAYMPWKGKAFVPAAGQGRNRFAPSSRPFFRLWWPGYRDLVPEDGREFTAFRFATTVGPSVTDPSVSVLKIDYDHPDSPWPIGLILDELVHVGDGQHLGQALMRWGGRYRRVAWFALETPGEASVQG